MPQTPKSDQVLTLDEAAALRERLAANGESRALEVFGLRGSTLTRAAAGLPVHRATLRVIREALGEESGLTEALVILKPDELRELIREAVAEALYDRGAGAHEPAVYDRAGIGRKLGVSVATVDRLVKDGMPFSWLGDSKRFDVADCVAWMKAQPKERAG